MVGSIPARKYGTAMIEFFAYVDANPVLILIPSLTIGGIVIIALFCWAVTPDFMVTAAKFSRWRHPNGIPPLPSSAMMDYSAATGCPIMSIVVIIIIMLVLYIIGDLNDHFILAGTIGITFYLFNYGIAYAIYRPAAEASCLTNLNPPTREPRDV